MVKYVRHINAERWLSAYVDHEAPARRQRAVERHLRECPECQAVVDFIVASKAVLHRAGARGAPRARVSSRALDA